MEIICPMAFLVALLMLPASTLQRSDDEGHHQNHVRLHQKCVSGFCLPRHYQKLEIPQTPTMIHVNLRIFDILVTEGNFTFPLNNGKIYPRVLLQAVNDKDFSITIYANLGMRWKEPRIYKKDKDKVNPGNSSSSESRRRPVLNPVDPLFIEHVPLIFVALMHAPKMFGFLPKDLAVRLLSCYP